MRRTLYIILILGSLLLMSAFLLLVGGQIFGGPTAPPSAPYPTFPSPIPPSATPGSPEPERPRLFEVLASGGMLEVRDFRTSETNAGLPPDVYVLAGGVIEDPTQTPPKEPYQIMFTEFDQIFTITLLQEPIGEVRRDAEQELLSILGVTERDACRLNVLVMVPYWLSEIYVGENLRMSFCERAVPLPE